MLVGNNIVVGRKERFIVPKMQAVKFFVAFKKLLSITKFSEIFLVWHIISTVLC